MSLTPYIIVDDPIQYSAVAELARVLRFAANIESHMRSGEWELTVRIASDAEVAALHDQFMADPSTTDVMAFPADELPAGGPGYLGDIVVSIDTAAAQARDAGHTTEREIAFLALHGFLHLCGMDDGTPVERDAMHARQHAILDAFERAGTEA